jgi:transposase
VRTHFIKKLLNLEGAIIKKSHFFKNNIIFYVEMPVSVHVCPNCGTHTTKIHDYYSRTIKDVPIQKKFVTIHYNQRRYECPSCGKSFNESNCIAQRYSHHTKNLTGFIVNSLRSKISMSDVAKEANVNPGFVSKMLPYLAITCTKLPRVLCIDEFKGNSGSEKYQVVLLDGETHEIIDIVECRYKHYLCQYFRKFSQEQLDNVKLFVTDLWETYKDISFTYFKHAKIIADRFHFSRYVVQAVDTLRKRVQSNLPKEEKRWFRRSRRLLLTRKHKIKREEDLEQLNYMLINFSEDLRIAYREKETFLDILHSSDSYDIKAKLFNDWICRNLNSPVEELVSVAKTYHHWAVEIRHALEFTYSNGCTEGVNNKIKTLKRLSFGMPNFIHFKARIMLLD